MPDPTANLANEFTNRLMALESTRAKMEALLAIGAIDVDDIEQVYSGLYVEAFTSFEGLLEDLFFGLVLGTLSSSLPDVALRVSINPALITREILLIGKQYHDWFPYKEQTLERANVFFQRGMPFARLDDGNKSNLQRFHRIRNAIAHKSEFAQRKFETDVLGSLTLTPRERKPSAFLRSIFRRPAQTQYEVAIEELKAISVKLCE